MKKTVLLLAAVAGMAMAHAQNTIDVFSASGGVKKISTSITWNLGSMPTDSQITIMFGQQAQTDTATATVSPVIIISKKVATLSGSIDTTVLDSNSLGGLARGETCVRARLQAGGATNWSSRYCGILVVDSLVKTRITFIGKPTTDSAGNATATVRITASGGSSVRWHTFGASDSTKVYKSLFAKDSGTVIIPITQTTMTISVKFGKIPANGYLYGGVRAMVGTDRDSTMLMKISYRPPLPATGEIKDWSTTGANLTIQTTGTANGLLSKQILFYQVKGTTTWFLHKDTVSFSGDSLVPMNWNILNLADATEYNVRVYSWNSLGGSYSITIVAKTAKTPILTTFGVKIDSAYGGNYLTGGVIYSFNAGTGNTGIWRWAEFTNDTLTGNINGNGMNELTTTAGSGLDLPITFTTAGTHYARLKIQSIPGAEKATTPWVKIFVKGWTVGLSEMDKNIMMVYPNPTTDFINLPFSTDFVVTNILGETVITGTGDRIDMRKLPLGTYIINTELGHARIQKQ